MAPFIALIREDSQGFAPTSVGPLRGVGSVQQGFEAVDGAAQQDLRAANQLRMSLKSAIVMLSGADPDFARD